MWVGHIPDYVVEGGRGEKLLREALSSFGGIVSATVRNKPGVNKSWALVRRLWTPLVQLLEQLTRRVADYVPTRSLSFSSVASKCLHGK